MHRFTSAAHLASWCGVTPRHRQSDTTVHRGPITKQGSKLVRWAAIEAAHTIAPRLVATTPNETPRRTTQQPLDRQDSNRPQTHHPHLLRPARRQHPLPRASRMTHHGSRPGCARVCCLTPSRRGRPLDCVHLIAAEPHHARPPGEEMTDTPGTPARPRAGHTWRRQPPTTTSTHHHHIPVVQPTAPHTTDSPTATRHLTSPTPSEMTTPMRRSHQSTDSWCSRRPHDAPNGLRTGTSARRP